MAIKTDLIGAATHISRYAMLWQAIIVVMGQLWVQVCGNDGNVFRQQGCKATGDDAGDGGDLEYPGQPVRCQSPCDIFSVRRKDQGNKIFIVNLCN
jgi:hypothetical protein